MNTYTLVDFSNKFVEFIKTSSFLGDNDENLTINEDVSLDSREYPSNHCSDLNYKDFNECLSSLNLKVEEILDNLINSQTTKLNIGEINLLKKLLRDLLKNGKIEGKSKKLLEISLLILIFLNEDENDRNEADLNKLKCTQDLRYKFDLCPQLANALANQGFLPENQTDNCLNFLVSICLLAVETGNPPNATQLCYEILVITLKSGHRNKFILPYIRNFVLSNSFFVASTAYTEPQYHEIYWNIRILQLALALKFINSEDFNKVLEFGLNSAKLQNKSIYILNEAVCLLSQLWLIEPFEFDLLRDDKLKLMMLSKLLTVGDESFLYLFSIDWFVKVSLSGPIELRKLAINCLSQMPKIGENEIFINKIDHLTYENNFKVYKSVLQSVDLGILAVRAKFLPTLKSSISYLNRLHRLLNNIIYHGRSGKRVLIRENATGITHSHTPEYTKFIVNMNNVLSGKMSRGRFNDWLKLIKVSLKRNYYSIFQLINAIIATRSVMYTHNSMGVKVQYTDDLSIYLLLRLDGTFRSICRDYIKCLTISSHHIDFKFITYIIKVIHNSVHNQPSTISKIVLNTMLIGVCEYLEILFECNVRDIYGKNHTRINKMSSQILTLFERIVAKRVVRGDFGLLSHVVTVLKLVYKYDENSFKRVEKLFLKVISIYEREDLSLEPRYKERIDGCKDDLRESIIDLYLVLSSKKLPFKIHERAILELVNCQNLINLCNGLINSVKFYPNKELVRTLAFQLSLLQVQNFDSKAIKMLKKLANFVFLKLNRRNCSIVLCDYRGLHMFKFKSYKFKIP
eukprot:XP_765155.1 hypothetical protein [Theileria parva strain Muguga]